MEISVLLTILKRAAMIGLYTIKEVLADVALDILFSTSIGMAMERTFGFCL